MSLWEHAPQPPEDFDPELADRAVRSIRAQQPDLAGVVRWALPSIVQAAGEILDSEADRASIYLRLGYVIEDLTAALNRKEITP